MWQTIAEWLATIVLFIQDHALSVRFVTGLMSLIFAIVILILRSKTVSVTNWRDWRIEVGWLRFWRTNEDEMLKSRDWAKWFGWGFAFFAYSYLLRSSLGFVQSKWGDGQALSWVNNITDIVSSGLVNICFLAAARSLRERKDILPRWGWCLFAFGLIGLVPERLFPFCRLPDAVFSCISLSWIGYATATNITIRRRRGKVLAVFALLVALLYMIAQIFYAISPILLLYDTRGIVGVIGQFVSGPMINRSQKFLDSLVVLFLLPLKFGLFLSALLVQLREIVILSSAGISNLLARITDSRREIFADDGFLEYAGGVVDAKEVELALLMPGTKSKFVLIYKWPIEEAFLKEENKPVRLTELDGSEIGRVIEHGVEIVWRNGQEYVNGNFNKTRENRSDVTIAVVPIKVHGAVVGCFRAVCPGRRALSAVAMTHLRVMADLASLAAQPLRELAAVDDFSTRFTEWRVAVKRAEVSIGIKIITELLQDILSPKALIVQSDIGFRSYREISGNSKQAVMLREQREKDYVELVKHQSGGVLDVLEVDFEAGPLGAIGKLALVVPTGVDELSYPILGANHLIRRTIGALVADAILDTYRDNFAHVLEDLVFNLNDIQLSNPQQWFDKVEDAAKEAGLLWAVVTEFKDHEFFGDEKWGAIARAYQLQTPQTDSESAKPQVITLPHPIEQTHHIISLCLQTTRTRIWLGVGRKGFGVELNIPSPWMLFLDRFSDIADSTLVRMTATQEMVRMQIEVADTQGMVTAAVTAETLFHQLMNMVRDIANPVAVLNYSLLTGELSADKDIADLIRMTGQSAERLLDFASEFMKVTKLGTDRPCSLLEAAQQSNRFYLQALNRYEIKLEINIAPDLTVDVPFHVASLAIANLVSNAKDALKARRGGVISIEAWDEGEMIRCCVSDNGSGIDPSVRERLFEIGATTKPGSGGWGLYLVKRSLVENRGNIDLVRTGADGTQFLIRFPKPR